MRKKNKVEVSIEENRQHEIPKNWAWSTLKDVCTINMGQSPKGEFTTDDPNNIPLIGGPADMGETYPKAQRYTTKPTKLAQEGHLIMSVRATLGKTNIADGQYCLGRGVAGISSEVLDIKLLKFYLETITPYLYSIGTGTTFKQVSKKDIENILIPLPPPSEQKRIAEKVERLLNQIDEAKQLIREADEKLETLKQTILSKAFRGELGTNDPSEENTIELLKEVLHDQAT